LLPSGAPETPAEDQALWTFDADLPSIAVLPFDDLNRSDSTQLFVDGLHDNLLSKLHKIGSLHVISRQSVLQYRGSEKSMPIIARELGGVTTVLEGTVQRSPDRVFVNVQLIDPASDGHLWSQDYDRHLSADNIFALQTELAEEITEKLGVRLTAAEEARLRGGGTGNLRALDLYDEALALRPAASASREASERVEELLREAIRLDPDFLEAYALLGSCFAVRMQVGYSRTWADSALMMAQKALELDSLQAQGWSTLGMAYSQVGRHEDSREALLRALELAPGQPDLITNLAGTNVELARYEEGLLLAVRSSRLDPRHPIPKLLVAITNSLLGRWDEALDWLGATESDTLDVELLRRTSVIQIELGRGRTEEAKRLTQVWLTEEPENPNAEIQFTLLEARDDLPAAAANARRMLAEHPEFDWFDSQDLLHQLIALDLMAAGDTALAREALREQEAEVSAMVRAGNSGPDALWKLGVLGVIQGRNGRALDHFSAAVDRGLIPQPLLVGPAETDPRLTSVRDHPRFLEILRTIEETRRTIRARLEPIADQLRPVIGQD
jgi:TolB-like protein